MSDAFHFLSLTLTNVRAFGGAQTLHLSKDGRPARWCVILGENGVGKTTLMQGLAVMRPYPSFGDEGVRQADGAEAAIPRFIEPELAGYENEQILGFVRWAEDGAVEARLEAELASEAGEVISLGYRIVAEDGKLISADSDTPFPHTLHDKGPLILAYGAYRHAGKGNLDDIEASSPIAALFDDSIQLIDADELIEKLDYALLVAGRDGDEAEIARRKRLKDLMSQAIAALLPDMDVADVEIGGTRFPGSTGSSSIQVRTPSGIMPLRYLSLGWQTTVAWAVDLAWRLFNEFPESKDPFGEPAIVLIDEIDLHLHPRWQRDLRARLLALFPRIQFIVTAHGPIVAMESIAAGDPLSVVRWEGPEARILLDPIRDSTPRIDQVLVEAFEMETPEATKVEVLLNRRRDLIRKPELSKDETALLSELNDFAYDVQTGSDDKTAELDRLMKKIGTPLAVQAG